MVKVAATLFLLSLSACGSGSSDGARCGPLAEEIRRAAIQRGYDGDKDGQPDAMGICTSTDPVIQRDFGKACADLKTCGD